MDVLPDRLSVSAGGRGPVRRHPPSRSQTAPGELPDLDGVPLGPRTSHDAARGAETLIAYRQWVARGGRASFAGAGGGRREAPRRRRSPAIPRGAPQRRFERVFERLALPGFARSGRYELLVMLGRLGLYELRPTRCTWRAPAGSPRRTSTTLAAKRVFGIGDPLLLERRAAALAQAVAVPVEALDLALANWISPQPATLGFPRETQDEGAFERGGDALGL